MVIKSQTGMQGVYLVAAELTHLGFIVSVTSRSARGADLLVTDQECQRAFSVQVKTNHHDASFWLLGKYAKGIKSPTHIYVFVNLKVNQRPEYHVVPSESVAADIYEEETKSGIWYSFDRKDAATNSEGWEVFGDSGRPQPDPQADSTIEISN